MNAEELLGMLGLSGQKYPKQLKNSVMLVLFGAPGTGKSVQGKMLAEKYGWAWLDLRAILLQLNDRDINRALKIGMSVVDEKATMAIRKAIQDARKCYPRGMILDGFPASYAQLKWLIDCGEIQNITGALTLRVPRGEIWRRLVLRKRVDDTRAAIERREDIFDRAITGMVRTLNMRGVQVYNIDGTGAPEDVLLRIEEILGVWGIIPKKEFAKIAPRRKY